MYEHHFDSTGVQGNPSTEEINNVVLSKHWDNLDSQRHIRLTSLCKMRVGLNGVVKTRPGKIEHCAEVLIQ